MQPIAIVGLSCRFPGAADPSSYWQLLAQGGDAITEVPLERWDVRQLYDRNNDAPGRVCTRWGGFLDGVDQFDAPFFNISPREAERVDPQQRLILELAWEALESAAIAPERLSGSDAGVFVAISHSDYARLINSDWSRIIAYNGAGMYHSIAANRLSYTLNLQGPSMVVDTACSSSLVAVHVACQHLRLGETSLAIVGGVNLNLDPVETIGLTKGRMLSPDGRCRTFDDSANGYVRSDGCGVVVLKRLEDALRDADPIRAVIRGSAVNQDGLTNGLYAPSGPAQQAVIRKALGAAGVAPEEVSYVEAHGTGTALGDPIEMRSIMEVLGANRPEESSCWIGAVKTNVGHLEAAAGMAGLIKTVLALEHEQIPRNLHFRKLNRYIKLDGTPFKLPLEPVPWPRGARKAGVSAFGFGGTNAHVILEEAPAVARVAAGGPFDSGPGEPRLLTLSAKTEPALRALARAYQKHLAGPRAVVPALRDVCHTANYGRNHFRHRLAIEAASIPAAVAALEGYTSGRKAPNWHSGGAARRPVIGFLFTGQGSQYAGMGRGLYERFPVYREHFERCARILGDSLGHGLDEMVFGRDAETHLAQTRYAQPALFALEYALARQLIAWRLEPAVLLGHSLGELVAAAVAEVAPLEQVLAFVAARARLMQALPAQGAMLAVSAPAELAAQILAQNSVPSVRVAAYNGPASFVLSGPEVEIRTLEQALRKHGVAHARLRVSHAFHSSLIEPIAEDLQKAAPAMARSAPVFKIVSNVTGELADDRWGKPRYWVDHAISPVMFWAGAQTMLKNKCTLLIEVGPHPVLCASLGPVLPTADATLTGVLRRGGDDASELVRMLAKSYVAGAALDWARYERQAGGRAVALPGYPFQRQRHWYEGDNLRAGRAAHAASEYAAEASVRAAPYLADHRINGKIVLPAAAYLTLAVSAMAHLAGKQEAVALENIGFKRPHVVAEDGSAQTLRLTLGGAGTADGSRAFAISDAAGLLVEGTLGAVCEPPVQAGCAPESGAARRSAACDVQDYYEELHAVGLEYGPAFRGIEGWRCGARPSSLRGRVALPREVALTDPVLHPVLLDACFQLVGVLARETGCVGLFVPAGLAKLQVYSQRADRALECRVELAKAEPARLEANIDAFDASGQLVCRIEGLRLELMHKMPKASDGQLTHAWLPGERPDHAQREHGEPLLLTRTLEELDERKPLPRTLVFLSAQVDAAVPSERILPNCLALVALAKALSGRVLPEGFRLVIATQGAHRIVEGDVPEPVQAALWGLGRVIAMEFPKLGCCLLDLPGQGLAPDALNQAIGACPPHAQIGWREGLLYRFSLSMRGDARQRPALPFRLALERYGDLESLAYRPLADGEPQALEETEIEVRVRAVGLNFRDVLNALGSLRGDLLSADIAAAEQIPFGGECAGIVTRIGSRVEGFSVGEAVIVALTPGCLADTVRAPAQRVIRKPAGIGFAAAATITTAYLTVYHAFRNCARVHAGQRVLVHAASGGVGQAAVGYLRRAGATVYATTSREKKAHIERQGVAAVLNSRSPDFAPEISRLTRGKGVDVVLNSLSGDFIAPSLDVLARGGVFIEIGKRGIWTEERVRAYRPDVRYVHFDLLSLAERDPALIAELLHEIAADLAAARIAPLPCAVFQAEQVTSAFRYLAAAKHVGKVVVDYGEGPGSRQIGAARFQEEGIHVIAGGLGVLGLRLAAWLREKGARHIVLVSRRAPDSAQREALERLRAGGAEIEVLCLDIAASSACQRIREHLEGLGKPLLGVFHLAGVLEDAALVNQTAAKFRKVMAPKVDGGWNLHRLSERFPDAFLVCYSSLAALIGSPGQANYAAANGFLDGLAGYRRTLGLHGLSINWGPFAQIGLSAQGESSARASRFFARAGLKRISWRAGVRLMEQHMGAGTTHFAVMPVDAGVFARQIRAYPQLAGIIEGNGAGMAADRQYAGVLEKVRAADRADASRLISGVVAEHLAAVLRMSAADIDAGQTWSQLGVDSLLAMEVKAKLEALFATTIDDALGLQSATVRSVSSRLLAGVLGGDESPDGATSDEGVSAAAISYLAYYAARRAPQSRLICFHQLGGSAAAYRDWRALLPESVDLLPIQLPGRENRSGEQPIATFEALIPQIAEDIVDYLDRPFALYGHSMGSLVAYEVCRHLAKQHRLSAQHLFVAGMWAPAAHARELERRAMSLDAVMADAEVPDAVLGDKTLAARLAKIFDSDWELFRGYRHVGGPALPIAITALFGSADKVARRGDMLGWQEVSGEPLAIHAVEGRHMFHMTNAAAVISTMSRRWSALRGDEGHEPLVRDMVAAGEIPARGPLPG